MVASKSRNGYVHPMISLLLATTLSCNDAQDIVQNIMKQKDLSTLDKHELIEVMKNNSKDGCWDAND